jgi:hypothetical protein
MSALAGFIASVSTGSLCRFRYIFDQYSQASKARLILSSSDNRLLPAWNSVCPNLLVTEGGMRLLDGVISSDGAARNFTWRALMRRYGILRFTTLLLAISAGAQGRSGHQLAASAEAQTNTNAYASASTSASQQKQGTSPQQGSAQSSASGSAAGSNSAVASAAAGDSSLNLSSDTPIRATLLTSVDARHSKPGDPVSAHRRERETGRPRGSSQGHKAHGPRHTNPAPV